MPFCTHLVVGGPAALSTISSHDVILMGQAIWPKLSLTNASHDEYGVCVSLWSRSDRCKRARRRGDGPIDAVLLLPLVEDELALLAANWSILLCISVSLCGAVVNANNTSNTLLYVLLPPSRYIYDKALIAALYHFAKLYYVEMLYGNGCTATIAPIQYNTQLIWAQIVYPDETPQFMLHMFYLTHIERNATPN